MATLDVPSLRAPSVGDLAELGRQLALGFAYWFAFDLVLEPGNIANAARTGAPIAWDQEIIRFTAAGMLGAAATPLVLALVRRFPIEGPGRWRRAAAHIASSAAFSAMLILASCPLATWVLASERRPLGEAMKDEMVANLLLLTFCMVGFVAMAHARRFSQLAYVVRDAANKPKPSPASLPRVAVKTRSGVMMIETSTIDWIETQGNYLALHVGPRTYLIRDTSKHFETLLDPQQFVRVHRRTIVAIQRVRELIPLGSGDAVIRLVSGAELRVSRGHRDALRTRLPDTFASSVISP